MIGFVQTIPNNIEGFSGFTISSLENVLVRVFDQNQNVIEGAIVIFNTAVEQTNEQGFVEYEYVGAYTIKVFASNYSVFNDVGIISGNETLDIVLTSNLAVAINAVGGNLLWSPIVNSFKFINRYDQSFLENESLNDLVEEDYMYGAQYCQVAVVGESRHIQFHSNGDNVGVNIRDYFTDALIQAVPVAVVASATKYFVNDTIGTAFDYYQATVTIPVEGSYYLELTSFGTAPRNLISEPFQSYADTPDHVRIEFQNDDNTEDNYWKGDFIPRVRVRGQLYRRELEGSRTIFVGSNDFGRVLSFRNDRAIRLDTFHLPPYMHEILAVGTSGTKFRVEGQEFYNDEAYSAPNYIDRFTLANGSLICKTTQGMHQQIDATVIPSIEASYVVNDVESNISDDNDNILIQG